jgi:hypothetical protein
VESTPEANAFINKVLTYEKAPASNYVQRAVFAAVTERGAENDASAAADFVPSDWTVTKLYQTNGQLSASNWISECNNGMGLGLWISHGLQDKIKINNSDEITITNVKALTNTGKYPVLTAVNCLIGAFDGAVNMGPGQSTATDCIVEHFMYEENGVVAFMANSRLGSPSEGATHKYNIDFFKGIFEEDLSILGEVYAFTKTNNVAKAKTTNEHSYTLYELNLHGDPSMALWTEEPKSMTVAATNPFSQASGVRISVSDASGAIDSAQVCIMWAKDEVIEAIGHTGADGVVNFELERKDGFDSMWVTVTKRNYLPVEKTIQYGHSTTLAHMASFAEGMQWSIRNASHGIDLVCSAPVGGKQRVSMEVFDISGRLLYAGEHRVNAGDRVISLRGAALSAPGGRLVKIRFQGKTILLRQAL